MKLNRILFYFSFFILHSSFLSAQVKHDTMPAFMADSLNTVYIFADTETTFNKIDKLGRKQGLWKKFYPDGKLRYEGHFIDDKPIGIFKNFYENDSLQIIRVFSDDGSRANIHIFYPTGALESEGKTVNEKNDSIWKYYDEWQRLIRKEQFKNGLRHGKSVTFYDNGNVAEIKTFKDDRENGPMQQFFFDGILKEEGTYVNGELQDTLFIYNPEGKMHIKGKYLNDMKQGRWIYYDNNGNPKDTVEYYRGRLMHPERYFPTQAQEDSLKIHYQQLQEQLDHPGSLEDESNMGEDNGGH